ncbi:unnamed protein product [Durusdinium trenchii]|uniref:Uncharacterized protein n=1 Tax=Durusdinium trenchii TaxID=1381693 RepID=A0ABP0RXQ4_9DINO
MLCRHAEALGRYEPGRVTAPPVWIEAAEEFETVRLSRLRPTPGKDLRNTAMGGIMGLHKSNPDEGFMRAALAASVTWKRQNIFQRPPHIALVERIRVGYLAEADGSEAIQIVCLPGGLKRLMAETQFRAGNDPYRFMELVRAEELSNFLNRADNSSISREEISKLGEALAATLNAGGGSKHPLLSMCPCVRLVHFSVLIRTVTLLRFGLTNLGHTTNAKRFQIDCDI